jgi:hypothetical protein
MKRIVPLIASGLLAAAAATAAAQAPEPGARATSEERAAAARATEASREADARSPEMTGSIPRQRTCVEDRDGRERCQDLR